MSIFNKEKDTNKHYVKEYRNNEKNSKLLEKMSTPMLISQSKNEPEVVNQSQLVEEPEDVKSKDIEKDDNRDMWRA